MLAIKPSSPQKCTPNLLPARISHDGPINDTHRYWHPETHDDGTQHTHFRGRHLHGKTLQLPEGYEGAILRVTDKVMPTSQTETQAHEQRSQEDGDQDEEDMVEVKVAAKIGTFEELVVWEHGSVVDAAQDRYVRGVGEWIGWAASMHCDEEDRQGEGK